MYEARQRGLSAELSVYEREESAVLDALTCADMTTGPAGHRLGFAERIEEILTRYAPGSEVHTAISAALPYLAAAVARADAGITGQPM